MTPLTQRRGARIVRRWLPAASLGALLLFLGLPAPVADAAQLAWTDTWFGAPRLYRAQLDGSFATSIPLPAGSLPEGLAFDPVNPSLFMGEAAWSGAFIRRTNAALASPSPFVAGPSCVRGLAMDPANGLLFWATSNLVDGCSIQRVNRNGTGLATVIGLGTALVPHGVAVDPSTMRVWWTSSNNHAISSIDYDGTDGLPAFACDPGSFPYGIAIDPAADHVYWTEYNAGRLMRSRRNGSNRTVLVSGLNNPTHLALDAAGGRLYWVDGGYGQGRVRSSLLDGTGLLEVAAVQSFGGIAVVPGQATDVPGDTDPEVAWTSGLREPWPNPAPGFANVAFTLAAESDVRLTVHDVAGRQVAVLADTRLGPGPHTRRWTAGGPGSAAPGVYFVRLVSGGRTWTRRLVLAR